MTSDPAAGPEAGLRRLRDALVAAFRDALEGVDRVALLDFPTYANAGDSAIWLGQSSVLSEPGMPTIAACSDTRSYVKEGIARRIGSRGAVLLHGGGNLGDLWPDRQAFRERVIDDFRGHRVVQAPQSIHFEDLASLARARAVFDAHDDLVLMLRDADSLARAREAFRARTVLVPDAAFGLSIARPPASRRRGIACVLRSDKERAIADGSVPGPDVVTSDWEHEPPGRFLRVYRHWIRAASRGAGLRRLFVPFAYAGIARRRVAFALGVVSRAEVVVTDRLHGHVLASIARTPHVVLPERTGKTAASIRTWGKDLPLVRSARTLDEALGLARGT